MKKNTQIKLVLSFMGICSVTAIQAEPNWKPEFNDKPVSPELLEAIEDAVPNKALVKAKEKRRILVFSATAGYRHKSIPTGKAALAEMGESTGAYEAIISDDPDNFEPKALETFDAVLLLSPTLDFFMPNKKQKKKFSDEDWEALQKRHDQLVDNLVDYVEAGGGLVGIHSATDACYKHESFGDAIGGYFDGHPWGAKSNVTIVVEDPEHELNKPVFGKTKDFSFKEEIYQFKPEPYSRERLRILLHLDPERSDPGKKAKREDNDYPVAWVQSVGKGRVFYSSLGHNDHIFTNPMMLKHFLAGIQFATGDLQADTTPSAEIELPNLK